MSADAPARLAPTLGRDTTPGNDDNIIMADVGISAAGRIVGDWRSLHDR